MCLFEAAHGRGPLSTKGPPLPKIRYTYPTMMKLGTVIPNLKKIVKIYKYMTHPLTSAGISIFLPEIRNICCIKKYNYRLHHNTYFLIILTLFEPLKIFLINIVAVLMMSSLAIMRLPLIKVFWHRGYDFIISVRNGYNKILLRDSNYNVDMVMWPKFGNCSTSMTEVIITSIL